MATAVEEMMTPTSLSERLIRMEGKIDAYAASQSAIVAEHERRLNGHDRDIRELREADRPTRTSPWTVVATVVGAVVGLGSVLTLLVTLMRIIPDVP